MTRAPSSDVLSPEDADTAFIGGVHVARMCVGLTPAEFEKELGEAAARMRESLRKAEIFRSSPRLRNRPLKPSILGQRPNGGGSIDLSRRRLGAEHDRCLILPVQRRRNLGGGHTSVPHASSAQPPLLLSSGDDRWMRGANEGGTCAARPFLVGQELTGRPKAELPTDPTPAH
jgi:hypothetical protein